MLQKVSTGKGREAFVVVRHQMIGRVERYGFYHLQPLLIVRSELLNFDTRRPVLVTKL